MSNLLCWHVSLFVWNGPISQRSKTYIVCKWFDHRLLSWKKCMHVNSPLWTGHITLKILVFLSVLVIVGPFFFTAKFTMNSWNMMQNFSSWLRQEHICIMENKQGDALKSNLVSRNNLQGKVLFKCCSWHDQGEEKTLSTWGLVCIDDFILIHFTLGVNPHWFKLHALKF
jgi:hypothetical protein